MGIQCIQYMDWLYDQFLVKTIPFLDLLYKQVQVIPGY